MNNTVTFKVAGNDVLTFMDRVKKKADELTSNMIGNAKMQADKSRDQLKLIEDQIKAIERKTRIEGEAARQTARQNRDNLIAQASAEKERRISAIDNNPLLSKNQKVKQKGDAIETFNAQTIDFDKQFKDEMKSFREQERQSVLQNKLLKDNIETIKNTSNVEVLQMKKNNTEVLDELDHNATPMEQMAREMATEKYKEDKEDEGKGGKKGGKVGLFGELMAVDAINKFLNTLQQFSGTQNGFDLINPASKGAGQIIGSVLGGIIGGLVGNVGGAVVGAGIGGSIGSTIGGGVGEFEQRRAIAAQEFMASKYRYEATTQKSLGDFPDMREMGVSAAEYLATLKQIAVTSASTANSVEQTNDVLEMEKGAGISKEVSSQFLTLFRGRSGKDISNLVGGVMDRGKNSIFGGGDYSFLNEFLGKMANLQTQLLANTDQVKTGTTYDILSRFNSLGGAFRAVDPRSAGLLGQINNSLVNPNGDAGNAASFLALRQSNPKMNIADLLMEREKGLSSPTYLRSMLQYLDTVGGDESSRRMNIAGFFGVNQSAAKRIYDNRKGLMNGNISQDELENLYKGDFRGAAEGRTTIMEKNQAGIANSLLEGWYTTLGEMKDSFADAMVAAFSGATISVQNGNISFTPNKIKQNTTRSGKVAAATANTLSTSGYNSNGSLNLSSGLNKF